jgi:hypothetical protein
VPKLLKRTAASKTEVTAINTRLTEISATLGGVRTAAEAQLAAMLAMRSLTDAYEMMVREQQLVLDTISTKVVAIDNGVANIGTTVTISADRFVRIDVYIEMWLERGDNCRVQGEEWYEQGKEWVKEKNINLKVRHLKPFFCSLRN